MAEAEQPASAQTAQQKKHLPAKAKPAVARQAQQKGRLPAYLVALAAVLGIVAGYAGFLAFQTGSSPDTVITQPKYPDRLAGILLHSDDCKICAGENSFEAVLRDNNIGYSFRPVEAASAEGRALVARYGIRSAPSLLIDANSVGPNWIVVLRDGNFSPLKVVLENERAGDRYLLPELRYDPIISFVYLVQPDETCKSTSEKISVLYFSDPYCTSCITSSRELRAAVETFGDAIDVNYMYYPQFSLEMIMRSSQQEVERLVKNYLCAAKQGRLIEMQDSTLGIYCDKDGDDVLTEGELSYCPLVNPHYGIPLTGEELLDATARADLNMPMQRACLEGIGTELGTGIAKAALYGINQSTLLPIAIVDCRLNVHAVNLVDAVCSINPDMNGCD